MNWFRWYHGTTTDPKLALIAHVSGQPMHLVIAVWAMLLETASQANPRGSILSFDSESVTVTLQTVTLHVDKIISAMEQKQMIVEGKINKFAIRQIDNTAAERMRNYRERLKNKIDDSNVVTERDVTSVTLRNVTPEESIKEPLSGNKTPYQEILDLYHENCPSLPKVRVITDTRKKKIADRWKQYKGDIAVFTECFQKVSCSPFMQGNNKQGWQATFDWFFQNDTNIAKVLEDKYSSHTNDSTMAGVK